jgi:hypothetical protein
MNNYKHRLHQNHEESFYTNRVGILKRQKNKDF